jgi:hypothetical protein
LLRNRTESHLDNLIATGVETLGSEVFLKQLEERFDQFRPAQSLPEETEYYCIKDAVHYAKPDNLVKRAPVVYPKFKFFITEVKSLLTNEHLEKNHRINLLALCIALTPTYIDFAKKRQGNYSNGIESARRLRTGFLSLIFATLFCSSQKPLCSTADLQISQIMAIGSTSQYTGLLAFEVALSMAA